MSGRATGKGDLYESVQSESNESENLVEVETESNTHHSRFGDDQSSLRIVIPRRHISQYQHRQGEVQRWRNHDNIGDRFRGKRLNKH